MATHDYVIANGSGAAVRSDLNGALAAIASNNSSATAPATTYAYMPWADTTAGVMKMRNGANSGWITLYQLDGEYTTIAVENGTAAAPAIYFKDSGTDTGIYSPGADQVAISTGGTARLTITTTGITSALAVDVPLGAVGTPSITFTGDTNTGIYSPAADTLAFVEGGVEALRIDSAGNLAVGASSTSGARLFVTGGTLTSSGLGGLAISASLSAGRLTSDSSNINSIHTYLDNSTIEIAPGSTSKNGISINGNGTSTNTNTIKFFTANSERMRLDTNGRLLVGTSTANASGAKLQTSDGITFPATQVACADANTLDDYEEGTWTPTILGSSTAGTGTYSSQGGLYTKTGNTVVVQFVISWTAHTGTGNLLISGLPFTVTGSGLSTSWATGYATNLTITGTLLFGSVQSNTNVNVYAINNGTASLVAMDTAATLAGTIVYMAA